MSRNVHRSGEFPTAIVIASILILAVVAAVFVPATLQIVRASASAAPLSGEGTCNGATFTGTPQEVVEWMALMGCGPAGTVPTVPPPTLVPTATATRAHPTPAVMPETGSVTDDAVMVDLGLCKVLRNSNLRTSAQKADNVKATISAGSEVKIAAVSEDNDWYQLESGLWIAAGQCNVIGSTGLGRGSDVITNTVAPMGGAIISATAPFSYVPGGEGFGAWAMDVIAPEGRTDCGRVWQATNGENLPWTAVLCGWKASNPAPKLQWPHATQLTVSGSGTIEFDLYRDMGAIQQMRDRKQTGGDPYVVANAKKAELGLGWFVQGFNGSVCINGTCQNLNGGGVFQLGFPHSWAGHHHVVITVQDGQAQFWQGEKLTSVDTWPAQ